MRDWSLKAGDPLSLTLAADARLVTPNYLNDQIWELSLSGGEPPSVSIYTTYGLRARTMRLFYRFTEAGKSITDPAAFHRPPHVRRFYPNFVTLDFVPVEGLEVVAEFWVPESHVLAGRLHVSNRTTFLRHLDLELCGLLSPLDGKAFGLSRQQQMVRVLAGATSGLEPIVFMTGGPKQGAGPHPSLGVGLDFEAGVHRVLTWACAAESTARASFELARRTTARNWDAERARIELVNARNRLEIYTGDPDWDAAFAFTQKAAFSLIMPGAALPHPSFVRLRGPDDGFSRKGDGSDYPPAWSGQSVFDTLYLASLLPTAPALRRNFLANFLSAQMEDGSIDARPGLARQRSRFLAPPLLAAFARDLDEGSGDEQFLSEAFPKLVAFFDAWFAPGRDRDGDGIPEWEHPLQTGFEDNPLFDVWYPWSQSLNIQSLLDPEIEALLLREAAALTEMGEKLHREEDTFNLRRRTDRLRASLALAWDQRLGRYIYRDRLTGASWSDRLVGSRKGSGEILPRRPACDQPSRLLIQIQSKAAATARPIVEVFGRSMPPPPRKNRTEPSPEVPVDDDRPLSERIASQQFMWRSGGLVAATELIYGKVERVLVNGLDEKDRIVVRTVDTSADDITLFTPLWAHIPDTERARLIVEHLTGKDQGFARPFGIPALPASPSSARQGTREQAEAEAMAMSVHLPWNSFIGEGLLSYGYRDEAARLTTRLMNAVILSLKQSAAFYERYHAVTGAGLGERGSLAGLAPLGLFLKALGVEILSPTRVRLEGKSPFPWTVTLVYEGLKIVRAAESTEVTFPNSAPITVTDPDPCIVTA